MLSPEKLIASFDIDGVINNYPFTFLDFLKKEFGHNLASKSEALNNLGKDDYDFHKDAYRKSDFKYQVEIDKKILNLIKLFKKYKFEVYVSTSRPFHLYPDMFKRTTDWLLMRKVPFDRLIKKTDLVTEEFLIHFDDELEHIYQLFDNVENKLFIHLSDLYKKETQILNTQNKIIGISKMDIDSSKVIKEITENIKNFSKN